MHKAIKDKINAVEKTLSNGARKMQARAMRHTMQRCHAAYHAAYMFFFPPHGISKKPMHTAMKDEISAIMIQAISANGARRP